MFRSVGILRKMSTMESGRPDWPWKKAKKVAMMLSFSGKKYLGMQRNQGCSTVEEELLKALRDSGAIPPEWYDNASKSFFQRASRTDKGVSAAKMVVSLKMLNEDGTRDKINAKLPSDIRVQDVKRVTKNFNSKNSCDARTYLYMLPTLAFAPIDSISDESYHITSDVKVKVNATLKLFEGSHYFHNYTSGKLPMEPSSLRFITDFEMQEPFERDGIEFAIIKVKGQSFMLNQIRKMIGMAIAVVKGYASEPVIEESWGVQRIDIPRAPGLGLLLEEVHYERYNYKFGKDGLHDDLKWESVKDEVEKFKEDFIFSEIVDTEREEKSMITWMGNLLLHKFEPRHFEKDMKQFTPIEKAKALLKYDKKESNEKEIDDDS
ncbi:pseudouridylate synthase 1 homolog isoform X2 [Lepeophtheirus salmonis]|uniref:pseudouridylate synthase 1 homolog isoform X2 n=1 Tax=Lepeophtheirus salmonis TaxID=72036 RepID=UPI001AEA6998|nr:tRNA pseudouridine synthase A-like isoform X2 [Lepeophtheirus salmonis]